MNDDKPTPTTVSNIGVAMFTVTDQDAALAFYIEKLGFEVRADTRFGEQEEMRWLEVAPPGSHARLALNPPMGNDPGGSSIGVETTDVLGEHARLSAIGGIDLDPEPMRTPGAPLLFMLRDPDGNHIAVVEAPHSPLSRAAWCHSWAGLRSSLCEVPSVAFEVQCFVSAIAPQHVLGFALDGGAFGDGTAVVGVDVIDVDVDHRGRRARIDRAGQTVTLGT